MFSTTGETKAQVLEPEPDTAAVLKHSASLSIMPRCLSQVSRDMTEHTDPGITSSRGDLTPERVILKSQNRGGGVADSLLLC